MDYYNFTDYLEVVAASRQYALVDGKLTLADDDVDVAKRHRLTQIVQARQSLEKR
jgi:hypothetical protein